MTLSSGKEIQSTLQLVQIYFATATFDNIERDKKIKEDQLSIIGGTMGLLTGFSIISGFEIIYFLLRCIINGSWPMITQILPFHFILYCSFLVMPAFVNLNFFSLQACQLSQDHKGRCSFCSQRKVSKPFDVIAVNLELIADDISFGT